MILSYTIGIKRKRWFGFKKYRHVVRHYIETEVRGTPVRPRMILELKDGSTVAVASIFDGQTVKVYPDFEECRKKVEAARIEQEQRQRDREREIAMEIAAERRRMAVQPQGE